MEETLLIRKTCASTLGTFAENMEKEFIIIDLIPSLKLLISDEQDSIRIICVVCMVPIVRALFKADWVLKVYFPKALEAFNKDTCIE